MSSNAFSAAFLLLAGYSGCDKAAVKGQESSVLRSIYREYKQGAIDECQLNGKLVYTAALNAYDAGTVIYNSEGKRLATCNWGWGPIDSMCKQLTSCETVYRCKGHITGEAVIDKYGLSKEN